MSLVPLPWWTSQSSTSTRAHVEPIERIPGRNRHVVEQAEAHRPRRLGMVPGRAQPAERDLRFPRNQRGRRRSRAPPAACSAASNDPADATVSMSSMPPPRALTSAIRSTYAAGCTASSDRPVGRRCELRLEPEPSAPVELLLDRADAGRALGVVARVVLERGGMVQVEAAGHGVGRAGGAARGGYRTAR